MSHRQLHGEINAAYLDESDAPARSFWRLLSVRMCEFAGKGRAEMCDTYTYMNLEGSADILARGNTPASTDLRAPGKAGEVAPPRVLYAHDSGGRKETESQRKDNSLESSSSRVTGCNIRCFLVWGRGVIHKFSLSAQSPPLPEIPPRLRKSVPSVERIQIQLLSKKKNIYIHIFCFSLVHKNILRVLRVFFFLTIRILLPQRSLAPQLRPCTCGGFLHLAWVIF